MEIIIVVIFIVSVISIVCLAKIEKKSNEEVLEIEKKLKSESLKACFAYNLQDKDTVLIVCRYIYNRVKIFNEENNKNLDFSTVCTYFFSHSIKELNDDAIQYYATNEIIVFEYTLICCMILTDENYKKIKEDAITCIKNDVNYENKKDIEDLIEAIDMEYIIYLDEQLKKYAKGKSVDDNIPYDTIIQRARR